MHGRHAESNCVEAGIMRMDWPGLVGTGTHIRDDGEGKVTADATLGVRGVHHDQGLISQGWPACPSTGLISLLRRRQNWTWPSYGEVTSRLFFGREGRGVIQGRASKGITTYFIGQDWRD